MPRMKMMMTMVMMRMRTISISGTEEGLLVAPVTCQKVVRDSLPPIVWSSVKFHFHFGIDDLPPGIHIPTSYPVVSTVFRGVRVVSDICWYRAGDFTGDTDCSDRLSYSELSKPPLARGSTLLMCMRVCDDWCWCLCHTHAMWLFTFCIHMTTGTAVHMWSSLLQVEGVEGGGNGDGKGNATFLELFFEYDTFSVSCWSCSIHQRRTSQNIWWLDQKFYIWLIDPSG